MRSIVTSTLIAVMSCASAHAALRTYYKGTENFGRKAGPAAAQFLLEKGRGALVLTGEHNLRMLFLEKQKLVRLVDDTAKIVYDLECGAAGGNAIMKGLQKQLAEVPPEQRGMAEQVMKEELAAKLAKPPVIEYHGTDAKRMVLGHECTLVEALENGEKQSDYCASSSADFHTMDEERATMKAMHACLSNVAFLETVGGPIDGAAVRAFQWDTSQDGFPLASRCFRGETVTYDVTMEKFDREKIDDKLFEVPKTYKSGL